MGAFLDSSENIRQNKKGSSRQAYKTEKALAKKEEQGVKMTTITIGDKIFVELNHLAQNPAQVTLIMDIRRKTTDAVVDGSKTGTQVTQDILDSVSANVANMAPEGYQINVYSQEKYRAA